MRIHSFSEVGADYKINEDSYHVEQHPQDPNVWLCFMADGQGGRSGGRVAAELASTTALELINRQPVTALSQISTWTQMLHDVDRAVANDVKAGFTTFVGIGIVEGNIMGVSSGDSAAWLANKRSVIQLTVDQHKNPPVGSGMAIAIPFKSEFNEASKLIVMTDGVWKYVGLEKIVDVIQQESGDDLLEKLQAAARLRGSGRFQDDFTVVLMEME